METCSPREGGQEHPLRPLQAKRVWDTGPHAGRAGAGSLDAGGPAAERFQVFRPSAAPIAAPGREAGTATAAVIRASARECRHPLGRSRRSGSRKRKGSAARPGRRRRGAERRFAERAAVSVGRRSAPHRRRSIRPGERGPSRAGRAVRGGEILPPPSPRNCRGPAVGVAECLIHLEVAGAELRRTLRRSRAPPADLPSPRRPSTASVVWRKWLSARQRLALIRFPAIAGWTYTLQRSFNIYGRSQLNLGHILRSLVNQWRMFVTPGLRGPGC